MMPSANERDLSRLHIDAASIPHFLHWDLAYLWMLGRTQDYVPRDWLKRIRLWRRLLHAFLAGQLRIREHEIEPHLRSYVQQYRISKLYLLEYQKRVVGLLSPVVLLRPLPDGEPQLPTVQKEEYPQIAQALSLTLEELKNIREEREGCGETATAEALGKLIFILERELEFLGSPGVGANIEGVRHELLVRIPYFGQSDSAAETVAVTLYHRQPSGEERKRWFVPRCRECGDLLTQEEKGEPITVAFEQEAVAITCRRCGNRNEIPLRNFFIWPRQTASGGREVIVWTDRGSFADLPSDAAFPPVAEVDRDAGTVRFVWNAGAVNDSIRRFVVLRFDFPVRSASIFDDALYRRYLELGEKTASVTGLPFRWGWLDAADSPEKVQGERFGASVRFRSIGVRGLPFRFTRYYGNTYQAEPHAGVAMFPGPSIHNRWKRHRIFLAGPCPDLHLRADGVALTPDDAAIECPAWPGRFAVETGNKDTGCSFFLPNLPEPAEAPAGLDVGLDFGTTNTVLYFAAPGEEPSTQNNALKPGDLREAIHWVARAQTPPGRLWWLPEPVQAAVAQDPYLFPSSVWTWESGPGQLPQVAIRWHNTPPCSGAREETGFKWDEGLQDRGALRVGYLSELFFWSIPLMLRRKELPLRTRVPLQVCVSFPLSFPYSHRKRMQHALEEVSRAVRECLGSEFRFSMLDESRAAVRVLGTHNVGELTLVADLGGRTLDVVLFRTTELNKPPEIIQVGSIDLGGELFIEKVAGNSPQLAWQYRDQIRMGQAAALSSVPGAKKTLDGIHVLAFEVIRTMAAAYRKQHGTGTIRILLIGNGWRLRDLFAGSRDPMARLIEWAESRITNTGLPGMEISRHHLPSIHASKHYVAVGALLHRRSDTQTGGQAMQASSAEARFPAGRRIEVPGSEIIEWYELIGDGGRPFRSVDEVYRKGLNIQAAECPELTPSWEPEIREFQQNLPVETKLRDWVLQSISDDQKLLKGPLQLMIENHWKVFL
jgi:hypothetical protein